MRTRVYIDGELILSAERPIPPKLTPEQIAAQEAADKKAREEAAIEQAKRDARAQELERQLESSGDKDARGRQAVQAELDKVRAGEEFSDANPPPQIQTVSKTLRLTPGRHLVRLEAIGRNLAGEVSVCIRRGTEEFTLLGGPRVRYTQKGWHEWKQSEAARVDAILATVRRPLAAQWEQKWDARHAQLKSKSPAQPAGSIDRIIDAKLAISAVTPAPAATDYEFVRRIYLDVWGLIPTPAEIRAFVNDKRPDKRERLIDRLTADARWADPWVGYWEDVLAENPVIFGMVPHSTGPFKKWIHQSFVRDGGYDRFATELVLMEGEDKETGTLGFQQSAGADVPAAEKALVVSQAFLAANMKCARCHDSPVNEFKQRDLFGIGALLDGKPLQIPETSSVGEVPGRRKPAVTVSSKPGDLIGPSFVFGPPIEPSKLAINDRASRETLAAELIDHRRFAEVGVNRIWHRFMGMAIVEPVDNWPRVSKPSHPELLAYLTNEFIHSGFSVRHIQQLILKSKAYQRKRDHALAALRDADRKPLFAAQPVRRLRAEELVDSLHRAVGRDFRSERMAYASVDYGVPKRTWQLVTLSNEEDNAILVRPVLQEILTTAGMFGWRDQRPDSITVRNDDPNPLQPLTLANGGLVTRLVRLTPASKFTSLAVRAPSLDALLDEAFLSTLSRLPSPGERDWARRALDPVWNGRRAADREGASDAAATDKVSYKDMLDAYRYIEDARRLEPATTLLSASFRTAFEDVLWVLFNTPEFVFAP